MSTEPTVLDVMYLLSRILGTFFILLLAAAILWKKKTLRLKLFPLMGGGGNQINVITLNHTVWIRVILSADMLAVYLMRNIISPNTMLTFEMLKLIIIDNICYRFLFPVYLIINAKSSLPELFLEKPFRKLIFFKSEQNLIPRSNDLMGKTPAIVEMENLKVQTSSKFIHVKEAGQSSFIYLGKWTLCGLSLLINWTVIILCQLSYLLSINRRIK